MQNLMVIMKAVSGCNLKCEYCYAGNHQSRSPSPMSQGVVERAIAESLAIGADRVEFCWHGGEPLLAGKEFYARAVALQKKYQAPGQTIVNAMQSNGTLVDTDWLEFLEENDFGPGISIDGPAILHDRQRPFVDGTGSHAQTMRAIRLFQERGHSVPILCVVTSSSVKHPHEVFEFFIDAGIKSIDFLPCSKIDRTTRRVFASGVDAQDYADFLLSVFDRWWQLDDPTMKVRYFENVLQGILGGRPTLCKFAGTCAHFLTVDTDGTVYPCDDFVGDPDFAFGNILDTDLRSMMGGEARSCFLTRVAAVSKACSTCEWFEFCRGGCSYYRYMQRGRFDDANYYCFTRKRVFEAVSRVVHPVAEGIRAGRTHIDCVAVSSIP